MKKTKRLIMSLIAFSSLCGEALAQQVKATDLEALPGETVSMTMLINTEGGSYIGLEFDIQFPTEGFTTTGNATNSLEGWDGQFFI
ncbi:MAG: hypothetical protein ACSW8D_16285, partial [Prevotella sp.]